MVALSPGGHFLHNCCLLLLVIFPFSFPQAALNIRSSPVDVPEAPRTTLTVPPKPAPPVSPFSPKSLPSTQQLSLQDPRPALRLPHPALGSLQGQRLHPIPGGYSVWADVQGNLTVGRRVRPQMLRQWMLQE